MRRHRNPYAIRRSKLKKETGSVERAFPLEKFEEFWNKNSVKISNAIYQELLDIFSSEKIYVNKHNAYGKMIKQEIYGSGVEKFCRELPEKMNANYLFEIMPQFSGVIFTMMLGADDADILLFATENREKLVKKIVMKYLRETKKIGEICAYIKNNLTEQVIFDQLLMNENYRRAAERLKKAMEAKKLLFENIETSTPDDYTKLFPLARAMERKFIIHIGPTNSGKTYQAMEELKQAESGIYLAPLRLLAYEQYEKMNREGTPCSMITGEEQIIMPGSFHQSSTIEMLNLEEEWDMAVIDEAQMTADQQRGGSWTTAILGIRAKTIHVCASADAEDVLKRMISSCGDTYEVEYHERKTPLVMDEDAEDFRFPEDVQNGDALIVFSRKDVHSVAAELQDNGITCSIIYGSLPYDVRHREAHKFASGETRIVVATDAIGMGMNLPIRRIVFLQTIKYDGVEERLLTASEVRQIAGRAGRYGIYDTGYVTSYYDYEMIKKLLFSKMIPIKQAMISIPEELLSKNGKVSTILEMWNKIPASSFYDKGDISEKIKVAKALEEIEDNRYLIRKFIKIPANPDNRDTFGIYMDYFRATTEGRVPDIDRTMAEFDAETIDDTAEDALQKLESSSAVYDFIYSYTRIFGKTDDLTRILEGKRRISEKIFIILDRQKLNLRACVYCGKKLKWSYKFNMCQECFRKRRHLRKAAKGRE